MEAVAISVVIGAVGGGILGYWLASHIHSVAASAASAVTRATTIPSGDVAALNTAISGLGDKLAANTAAVGAAAAKAVTSVSS